MLHKQTQRLLEQLPPAGLAELSRFIEFLYLKYRLKTPKKETRIVKPTSPLTVPADSLTHRFRGFVQAPLTVSELTTAYELSLMGDVE
ncbi:hypothetical protein QUF63_09580 [Anaerolineales bacterium HSG25]|nr:hypothetical protein [Anaerolineales bacterium HSG25]